MKRVLSNKDIVILDGANYIKGWRYQLYCEAKAVKTPHCVIHIGTPVSRARGVNDERLASRNGGGLNVILNGEVGQEIMPYESECWENLVYRYEEPNAMARWDSPLFTVLWEDETPPYDAIWDTVVGSEAEGGKKTIRPNQATVLKAPSSENYLYELDRSTQVILNRILRWATDHPGEGGGEVSVSEDGGEGLVVDLPTNPVGLPALQRLRRQFMSMNRQNAVSMKRIRESFVRYLNDSFQAA